MFMDECTLYSYADDNSLSCTAPTIDVVISNLQLDGSIVIKWFTDNGMQANPKKLQFFYRQRQVSLYLNLCMFKCDSFEK